MATITTTWRDTLVKYNGGADMTKLQAGQKLLIPLM